MLLGYGLDYLLYQRLVQRLTFVGAILIFLAVLTMLLTQVRRDSVKDKLPVDEDRDSSWMGGESSPNRFFGPSHFMLIQAMVMLWQPATTSTCILFRSKCAKDHQGMEHD